MSDYHDRPMPRNEALGYAGTFAGQMEELGRRANVTGHPGLIAQALRANAQMAAMRDRALEQLVGGWVNLGSAEAPVYVAPVVPERVKFRTGEGLRSIAHPASPTWNMGLDDPPPWWESIREIGDWLAQRRLEERILEDMAVILKDRPADAPGLILFKYPNETYIVESAWIPSGTIIYSMEDQPDLMVKIDPDDDRVLFYRQGSWPGA